MSISLQRLSVEADKAVAAAAAAKLQVRVVKSELKKARKQFKTAKKAAKLARKRVEAAAVPDAAKAVSGGTKRASRSIKPRVKGVPSASQVAKAVITRMSVSRGPRGAAPRAVAAKVGKAATPPSSAAPRPDVVQTAAAAGAEAPPGLSLI